MEDKSNINSSNNKVFFIVSNKTEIDNSVNYNIPKTKGVINFKNILAIKNYHNLNYTINVFYF